MTFVEHFDEVAELTGFVYAPFHRLTNYPVVFFHPEIIFENENFENSLLEELENCEPLYQDYKIEVPISVPQKEYLQQAEHMIGTFNDLLSKAVLSRVTLKKKPENFQAENFFLQLTDSYPEAFCHLINIPGAGCWAGATPEALLTKKEKFFETVALAGTMAYTDNKEVLWGDKECKEQEVVSGHIEDVIKKVGIRDYKKSQVENLKAGQLLHLSTRFKFPADSLGDNFGDFIQKLHPTPAVCGYPKETALDLILKTEKHNREYYSGFCGPINYKESTDLFVNLRCMKILKENLAFYSGGGLTAGSVPINEWEETQLKAKTLLSKI